VIRLFLIACLGIATVGSHAALAQQGASDTPLARMTFKLDGEYFVIFLPKSARHATAGISANRVAFNLTKGQRLQRSLDLATADETGAEFAHRLQMTSGSLLEFQVKDNTGGGSGGPIAELTGRMKVGMHVLSVLCTDQDELNREPDWCLPYLNSLEIARRTQ